MRRKLSFREEGQLGYTAVHAWCWGYRWQTGLNLWKSSFKAILISFHFFRALFGNVQVGSGISKNEKLALNKCRQKQTRVIRGYWISDEHARGSCFSPLKLLLWSLTSVLHKAISNLPTNEKCIGEHAVYHDLIIRWDTWSRCSPITPKICNNLLPSVFPHGGHETAKGVVHVNRNYFFSWIRKHPALWL